MPKKKKRKEKSEVEVKSENEPVATPGLSKEALAGAVGLPHGEPVKPVATVNEGEERKSWIIIALEILRTVGIKSFYPVC